MKSVALTARDQGCTFPGCDQPPEHCQRHHITAWADGGATVPGQPHKLSIRPLEVGRDHLPSPKYHR
jgi:hypothetical protein